MTTQTPSPRALFVRRLPYIVGGLVCVGLAVLYFVLRVQVHTFDAISYAWNVRDKAFGLLFHPHHLLYAPVGRVAYLAARGVGYTGYADAPIQLVNAFAGGLGVFLFWRFAARWLKREWPALAVSAVLGLCYAYWLYASEVEVYTIAAAFLILCMWLLTALQERPTMGYAALLGVAHTGAIMFHQTNALFAVPVSLFLLMHPKTRSLPLFATYAGVGAASTLGIYGAVGLASGFANFSDFFSWFMGYTQSGLWGGFLSAEHLPALRAGLQVAVSPNPWVAGLFYAAGLLGLGVLFMRGLRTIEDAAWLAFGTSWLVVYGLFFWWWEPWNIEFWIATLPLWGLFILAPLRTTDPPQWVPITYTAAPAIVAALLFAVHLGPIRTLNNLGDEYYFRLTQAIEDDLTPADLVVTRGNVLDIYLPFYLEHTQVLSMREVTQAAGGDRGAVMGSVLGRLDWAANTGQIIVMDGFLLDEPLDSGRNPFGFTAEEIATLQARYSWVRSGTLDGQTVSYHTPRYDDPTRTGWDFGESLQGWSAYGIDAPRFEEGGWCITGGFDPQLNGPPIALNAESHTQLTLDMTVQGAEAGTYAEFFWRTPELDYSLDRTARIDLREGRHTYTVDLTGAEGWSGTVIQLRLDPIPGDRPITACVHTIALD